MFSFLTRQKHKEWLGIAFEEEGVAIAHLYLKSSTIPCLKFCSYFASNQEKEQKAWVSNLLAEGRFAKTNCALVLPPKGYQLLLVEPPQVEANELVEALRWQVKDMITYPPEEAVLDYFELCEHPPPGKTRWIYAVAAQKSLIQSAVDFANQQKLNLSAIDIRELALGSLIASFELDALSFSVLVMKESSGLLTIFSEGSLYLTREFSIGYQSLINPSDDAALDNLSLEIQRSLDYYDSQFGQKPVTEVLVMPLASEVPNLEEELAKRLGLNVKRLELRSVLEGEEEFSSDEKAKSLFAIAAATRLMMESTQRSTFDVRRST